MLIRDTLPEDAKLVSALIDAVARERRYLAGTSGFSEESTASFIAFVRAAKGVHVVAPVDDAVVGWCDITPASFEGMTHVGRLGMGVKTGFRGQGIEKGLLKAALDRAFGQGPERVELEVFRSNDSAVRLYEAHGFLREGVRSVLGSWTEWQTTYCFSQGSRMPNQRAPANGSVIVPVGKRPPLPRRR